MERIRLMSCIYTLSHEKQSSESAARMAGRRRRHFFRRWITFGSREHFLEIPIRVGARKGRTLGITRRSRTALGRHFFRDRDPPKRTDSDADGDADADADGDADTESLQRFLNRILRSPR